MSVKVIYEIFHILNMTLSVMNTIYAIEYIEAPNSQDVNRV